MTPDEFINLLMGNGHYILGGGAVIALFFKHQIGRLSNGVVDVLLSWFDRDVIKKIRLQSHPYFMYMDSALVRLIDKIMIENKTKQFLMRTFLKVQFQSFKDNFKKALSEEQIWAKMPKDEFNMYVLNIFTQSITEYNDKTRSKFKDLGLDNGVIDLIIDKFNLLHEPIIELVESNIKDTCMSDFYASNKHRFAAALYKLKMGFELTLINGKETFLALNGKLDNVTLRT